MFFSNTLNKLLVVIFVVLLSGCGWQLRGYHSSALDIPDLSLSTQHINNPMFVRAFKDTLGSEYEIQFSSDAPIKASITQLAEKKRVSSKDRSGDTSELEHTITLTVSTTLPDKKSQTQSFISVRRQSYDQDNLLSSDLQERSAKLQAYQELTRQYASYLATQLGN
jgi:outer membrane lipopolysaccharide assembly protein LptE/RlpB